jgi:hypothetical protein
MEMIMQNIVKGTFHFHSTYSHDGRSSLLGIASALSSRGFSFCILTDHFEDFDEPKFNHYLREARVVTEKSGFFLIPGIEANISGLDTILFPARDYAEIARFVAEGRDTENRLCKILAHASKYPFEAVAKHLDRYAIEGVELWNQQADGSHLPPFKLLQIWGTYRQRKRYRYFFGCDLHNVNLKVANVVLLSAAYPKDTEEIVGQLRGGDFASRNLPTGIEYCNGSESSDFDEWLGRLRRGSYGRGRFLGGLRSGLKSVYRMLPRDTQRSLNDIKNFVRNKV